MNFEDHGAEVFGQKIDSPWEITYPYGSLAKPVCETVNASAPSFDKIKHLYSDKPFPPFHRGK